VFGAGGGTSSYREAEDTDLIVLWGSNARETHPIFFHHVLKAVNKGAKLYAIDPRRTSSAGIGHFLTCPQITSRSRFVLTPHVVVHACLSWPVRLSH
jgi:predicted molibdopterin-dependent oxidoreductase YjgC